MTANQELCDICEQRHVTKSSTVWCPECEQAFCDDCNAYHGFSKLSKHHVTVSIQDHWALSSSISQISNTCMDHNEHYQMVCQAHDELLCLKCIEKHDECKGILPISKVIENVKNSSLFQETQTNLNDINKTIEMLQNELKKQQESIKQQEETILSQITDTRNKINDHLDKLESQIRNEVTEVTAQLNTDMNKALQILESKNVDTNDAEQKLKDLDRYATNIQTYLGLRKISSEASTTESCLQSIIEEHSLDEITLQFKVNDQIRNITNNIKTFGSVKVQKTPCQISLVSHKNKQAQLVETKIGKSIADIKLKLKKTTKTGVLDIRGIVVLPSGYIALSDYNNDNIVVFSTDGKRLSENTVKSSNAFDVTYIDDKTIATTSLSYYCVNIIDIETKKATQQSPTNCFCYGIIHHNGSLYVCASNIGILKLNLQDGSNTVIVKSDLPSWSYIEIFENKIYFTNDKYKSVTCCDMQGKQIWTFIDEKSLIHPRGLAVDNSGNVYVACTSNHLVVISSNGQQSRELLSGDDGLINPRAIHFDRKSNCLLIANEKQTVFTYETVH